MTRLVVTVEAPGEASRSIAVDRSPCRIGRHEDADLALAGWRVGREHAAVSFEAAAVRIADLGTLGGTRLNGVRLEGEAPLLGGDVVGIGAYRLQFRLQTEEAAQEPASPHVVPVVPGVERQDAAGRQRALHQALLAAMDLRRRDLRGMAANALRDEVRSVVEALVDASPDADGVDREELVTAVLDEALGLGPLERLLQDPEVSEIMVNAADDVWVERNGKLRRHAVTFTDDEAVRQVIDRIVAPLGRRIDEASPMVDARLPDGSRMNAVIPPLAVRGPAITIRRFARTLLGPNDLVERGSASAQMLEFLRLCIEHRRNIVISGGTGSGKTTLLNVLSNLIPAGERIITIEDSAELSLRHEHLVRLEARPANLEGRGEVGIRELVRNALRMRPDRIVVGECRGGETLDMLQAMNTGHDGSLTTLHANGARDVVSRLEVMTLMSGVEMPVAAIREQIASAVDVVVHQARAADGARRIAAIVEVTGMEAGRVQMLELFRHAPGVGFVGCGAVPTFYETLRQGDVALDLSIFGGESR